jgi:hypothetical protein
LAQPWRRSREGISRQCTSSWSCILNIWNKQQQHNHIKLLQQEHLENSFLELVEHLEEDHVQQDLEDEDHAEMAVAHDLNELNQNLNKKCFRFDA